MTSEASTSKANVAITEDEAALYDRQIRLWGVEAQQRMRNSAVLVINLKGLATETIKNIVLAGIGKLILLDQETVTEEDLGAGFFFTDENVGMNRATAARDRVQDLNPRVVVETVTAPVLGTKALDEIIGAVDLVCVTDMSIQDTTRINEACAALGKKFYCGCTYGMMGYVFCDLGRHEFIEKDKTDPEKNVKRVFQYPRLIDALQHTWQGLNKRETKILNPAAVFSIFALLEFQGSHQGELPNGPSHADELELLANSLIEKRGVLKQVLPSIPREKLLEIATQAVHEFPPVCAIVGGLLGQDILKTLQAKDAPYANFLTFEAFPGSATVCSLAMQ
ncbi:hypothetical protein DL93DRAFT_2082152 [Clavulina sp. PMI_390]|nr:hypothetical protein DL93DRAFT_2082152 [Clavulina sp. PMI_390]